jgi:hypothetical protein
MMVALMYNIQEIFNTFDPPVMSPDQHKAFYAIKHCRTSVLGSHIYRCSHCNHEAFFHHSCRNRHCPICQGAKQYEWVDKQLSKLLPVSYFHIVFTLPHGLNSIIWQNQALLYDILIRSAADSLKELAADKKYLGAQIGITAVLHTWGQNLSFHPHLHCIVPGGGLSSDCLRFVQSGKKFFIPVRVISRKFRGKFLYYFNKAFNDGKLVLWNDASKYLLDEDFAAFKDSLYKTEWIVFTKKPFKSPAHVVKYLGRYTHRVAISNARIKAFDDSHVSFEYKDYRDKSKKKIMQLKGTELIRRFLLHVLPSGFTKIRHYGILCSRNIGTKLVICMKLLNQKPFIATVEKPPMRCPICGCIIEHKSSSERILVPS